MPTPEVDGFELIHEPPYSYYIRSEWKAGLLEPLRSNFSSVGKAERTAHTGRVEHFSFEPQGAPGRVLVRRAVRAGIASPLGDLHLGYRRFLREMSVGSSAKRAGINVPEIVAARIMRVGPLLNRFTIVVREILEARTLHQLARDGKLVDQRRAIVRLGESLRHMHERGVYHGDLTLNNVLLTANQNGRQMYFVDFDGAHIATEQSDRRMRANLSRLNRFVEKWLAPRGLITLTDKMRFLLAYAGDRARARELARRCGSVHWRHRLWWSMIGHNPT